MLRCGLVLAGADHLAGGRDDGILTAREALGLDLTGTRLAVLSACKTGVGDVREGDGVHGLRRALVLAGAESLVMSLWSVDDEATRDLMVGFYRRLDAQTGVAGALRDAQRDLLARLGKGGRSGGDDSRDVNRPERKERKKERKEVKDHPFFWAAFVVAGNPRALDPVPDPKHAPTPARLVDAAAAGDAEAVSRLLDAGAHIDGSTPRNRTTPLIAAARGGHADVVRLLLARGARENPRDRTDMTALMWASLRGHETVATRLLEHGVDLLETNLFGDRAADLARARGFDALARRLDAVPGWRPWQPSPAEEVRKALIDAIPNGERDRVELALARVGEEPLREHATELLRSLARREEHDPYLWRLVLAAGPDLEASDGGRPLVDAAGRGNEAAVRLLLAAGADVNAEHRGSSALSAAVAAGHASIVRMLLEAGAKRSGERLGPPLVVSAAKRGHAECLRILLANGWSARAPSFPPVIEHAAHGGHVEAYRVLEEAGAEASDDAPWMLALATGRESEVRRMLDAGRSPEKPDAFGDSPLALACRFGRVEVARLLLARGADASATLAFDRTALSAAAVHASRTGETELLAVLLDAGADPNARAWFLDETVICAVAHAAWPVAVDLLARPGARLDVRNALGQSLLEIAGANGDLATAAVLLRHGAPRDVGSAEPAPQVKRWVASGGKRVQPPGALLVAAAVGDVEGARGALARGASVDATDDFWRTPLMLAARNGHEPIVRLLLERGADPALRARRPFAHDTKPAWTALAMARRYRRHAVERLLVAAGARD